MWSCCPNSGLLFLSLLLHAQPAREAEAGTFAISAILAHSLELRASKPPARLMFATSSFVQASTLPSTPPQPVVDDKLLLDSADSGP